MEAKPVKWSQFESKPGYERIDFISKASHLRSKDSLKRIPIGDVSNKKSNLVSVIASSTTQENATKVEKPIKSNQITNGGIVTPAVPVKIEIPKTSAQFFKTWHSLKSTEQKFEVLKGIYSQDVCKLLGAQLNLNIVREILSILQTPFVKQKLPIANILYGVVKNPEFEIIGVMMNADDKNTVVSLFDYMMTCDQDKKMVSGIKKVYEHQLAA